MKDKKAQSYLGWEKKKTVYNMHIAKGGFPLPSSLLQNVSFKFLHTILDHIHVKNRCFSKIHAELEQQAA